MAFLCPTAGTGTRLRPVFSSVRVSSAATDTGTCSRSTPARRARPQLRFPPARQLGSAGETSALAHRPPGPAAPTFHRDPPSCLSRSALRWGQRNCAPGPHLPQSPPGDPETSAGGAQRAGHGTGTRMPRSLRPVGVPSTLGATESELRPSRHRPLPPPLPFLEACPGDELIVPLAPEKGGARGVTCRRALGYCICLTRRRVSPDG